MEALGINLVNVVIYILLFFVLYAILDKFLISAVIKMLDKRQKELDENHGLKTELEQKSVEFEKEFEQKKQKTDEQAKEKEAKVVADAKAEAKSIVKKAQEQADEIIKHAEKKIKEDEVRKNAEFRTEVETKAKELLKATFKQNVELDKKLLDQIINNA